MKWPNSKSREREVISLKGLRHEDFAVLGRFCAKIVT